MIQFAPAVRMLASTCHDVGVANSLHIDSVASFEHIHNVIRNINVANTVHWQI